jgi:UDP-N-acetylmuramate--alanine ligase
MKQYDHIATFYFIGIGGIGMSALARYCKLHGKQILGYDKTPSELTNALIAEGISISFQDSVGKLPAAVQDREKTLVVYTPAIPKNSALLGWFQQQGYTLVKRSKLLADLTENTLCLAVAGTHGKTTTSAILGHLLAASGMPVTAFLGGIAENYQSNFISKGITITVVEADEFDRSFLALRPDIACVTSMDADHLDIYGDAKTIIAAFQEFAALLPDKTMLLHKKGLPLNGKSVAIGEAADYAAENIRIENGTYNFDLKTPTGTLPNLQFQLPGHHNLHNAVTALGMAILAGSPTDRLPRALATFQGVERRFSYRIKRDDLVLIDDYAHHPTEIDALCQAVREMYPNDEIVIAFQPHLFSRTRDFAEGFAESLSKFDEVLLLDIYPAREEPIPGITAQWLLDKIDNNKKKIVEKTNLSQEIKKSNCRIKLLVGAGDIGAEVKRIAKYLNDEA